jgi:hypothetical protein
MASSDFKVVLQKDSTISDITPELVFAVESGASSTTYQAYPATSPSNSSVTFSVQVPSESIVLGRDILIRSGLSFQIRCGSTTEVANQVPIGQPALKWGVDCALSPFPLASLMTTVNCQINNTNVSINLADVLPQILQMNSREHLAYYNGACPSLPDGDYGAYSDALGANNNPLASYVNDAYSNKLMGRGAYPVSLDVNRYAAGGGGVTDKSLIAVAVTDTWIINVVVNLTEPVFLSPWTWGNPERNAQGLVGINNMAFTFNIDSGLHRLISSSSSYITAVLPGYTANAGSSTSLFGGAKVGLQSADTQPTLLLKFLSTQPSDLIESKNVVPYTDFPRYLTTPATQLVSLASADLNTQSIQINQMPSKIIIVARKPFGSVTPWKDPATFLTITAVSINLNNASGLLSSSSQNDLWRMSVRNGSNQTWAQFSGQATKVAANYAFPSTGISLIPTGGSMLVLNPVLDLSLPDYITNGSLGNYNLQIRLTVANQYGATITPELIVMCVNDGIMTSVQGTSQTFTGIITKQLCLDAKAMKPMSSVDESRMVGGAMLNMSIARNPRFGMRGAASSGGASSGGAISGGARGKLASLMC